MCFTFWNFNILEHMFAWDLFPKNLVLKIENSIKYFFYVFANDFNWVRLTLVEAEWWFIIQICKLFILRTE